MRQRGLLVLAALAVPLCAALIFVARFATEMPLTDEWAFTQSVMDLQAIDRADPQWLAQTIDAGTWQFNGHVVTVPFLVYWLIAPLVRFDQRVFVGLTIALLLLELAIYRRWFRGSSLALLPVAVAVLGLAHYMDFLWGFQYVLALSVALPMAGLAAIDSIRPGLPRLGQGMRLAAGLLLILLGSLSMIGGLFGFAAAALCVAIGASERRSKLTMLGVVVIATIGAAFWLIPETQSDRALSPQAGLQVLTALGALIWGMPVGLMEFGLDLRSATGALILLCLALAAARAWRRRMLPRIALPLSLAASGLLCLASIAVERGYLGNWHLHYGLPAICGAYACAFAVWREEPRAAGALIPFTTLAAVLLASVVGSGRAFTEDGPKFRNYARKVERYAQLFLREPDLRQPFPPAPELSPDLVLYLSANHNPLFERPPLLSSTREVQGERVFVDGEELLPPRTLGPDRKRRRITVLLPPSSPSSGARLMIGNTALRLHEIHPDRVSVPGSEEATCLAGLLLPEAIAPSAGAVVVLVNRRSQSAKPGKLSVRQTKSKRG